MRIRRAVSSPHTPRDPPALDPAMFSHVVGLLSHDMAVDLGTTQTRVRLRDDHASCDEATALAVHTCAFGSKKITAAGGLAMKLEGRSPEGVEVVRPVSSGRLKHLDIADAWIRHLMHRVHGRRRLARPIVVTSAPASATTDERRRLRDCFQGAGARKVHMVPRGVAAATGFRGPIGERDAWLVVDVGGGVADVSVVDLHGSQVGSHEADGGDAMDRALVDWFACQRAVDIGPRTAERLKRSLGSALLTDPSRKTVAHGRCRRRKLPIALHVTAGEVQAAIQPVLNQLNAIVRRTLNAVPAATRDRLNRRGVLLSGGGSLLPGLDAVLHRVTGLPVTRVDHPTHAVVNGLQRVLQDRRLRRRVSEP